MKPTHVHALFVASMAAYPLTASAQSWNNNTANWSVGSEWTPSGVPVSGATTSLTFGGTGASAYTATDDLAGVFQLNGLLLNSSSTGIETIASTGGTLGFVSNGPTTPTITQSGSGGFAVTAGFDVANPLTLGGAGAGITDFSGVVTGAGGMTVTGGSWRLSNNANTFTGGITINTGATVEAIPSGAGNQNAIIAPTATSLLGNASTQPANAINLNGGTLKLTTKGSGGAAASAMQLGNGRIINFGINGGTLDLTNTSGVAGVQGGGMATGTHDLVLNTVAGAAPAVIKFNGGQLGLSNNAANDSNWVIGNNAVRINSIPLTSTGPIRFELTNGAMTRLGAANGAATVGGFDQTIMTINAPTTVRGVIGGEPTSGPLGTVAPGTRLDVGRAFMDSAGTTNYTAGLVFEGAMQVTIANGPRAINGNITVAGNGNVGFTGRGTGTGVGNAIINLNTSAVGINNLYLGRDGDDTLTIQDGGKAVFDLRSRADQANANGVTLDAKANIQAGASLSLWQSSAHSGAVANTTQFAGISMVQANVGDHMINGDIQGNGTTAKESVFQIAVPIPTAAASLGQPSTLIATAPAAGTRPLGGVTYAATSDIIVNGSGLGGLLVTAVNRPANIFNWAAGPPTVDPVTPDVKINGYLTATRLAALTGTGGYLTPAPDGVTFSFPAGGEWSSGVSVGLRAINNNTSGNDISLASLSAWSHPLQVDNGAAVSLGTAPFGLNSLVTGQGTIIDSALITLGPTSNLSPGNSAGALTFLADVSLTGTVSIELGKLVPGSSPVAGTDYDQFSASSISLSGSTLALSLLNSGSEAGDIYWVGINTGAASVGGAGQFAGLPEGTLITLGALKYEISYNANSNTLAFDHSGNDIALRAIPEPASLLALGLSGLMVSLRRRRR